MPIGGYNGRSLAAKLVSIIRVHYNIEAFDLEMAFILFRIIKLTQV